METICIAIFSGPGTLAQHGQSTGDRFSKRVASRAMAHSMARGNGLRGGLAGQWTRMCGMGGSDDHYLFQIANDSLEKLSESEAPLAMGKHGKTRPAFCHCSPEIGGSWSLAHLAAVRVSAKCWPPMLDPTAAAAFHTR